MTHIDLFTGLGGFSLAAKWNGLQTVVMCEVDKYRRAFLERTWPGIPIIKDVREFDGTLWRGATLMSAGTPCQPASRAGKQGGAGDLRWLWPQVLRVLSEARPDWCLFENPPGIDDVGLDGILAEVAGHGYEIGPIFDIPACAVGSPQLRHRYWIVAYIARDSEGGASEEAGADGKRVGEYVQSRRMAHADEAGRQGTDAEPGADGLCAEYREGDDLAEPESTYERGDGSSGRKQIRRNADNGSCENIMGYPECEHEQQRTVQAGGQGRAYRGIDRPISWDQYAWVPCADGKVRRAPYCLECVADGVRPCVFGSLAETHRSLLGALGDSIVPQVAHQVIKAIVLADSRGDIGA